GTLDLAIVEERARAQRECARIQRVQHQDALGAADTFTGSFLRFLGSAEHAQRLPLQHGALKIFLPYFRRLAKQLRRALDVAGGEGDSAVEVVGLKEAGVEPYGFLEFAR